MTNEEPKYVTIAMQDLAYFINDAIERKPVAKEVQLDLVQRIEAEYSYFGKHTEGTGKFAVFNAPIEVVLGRNRLLNNLRIRLAGNGAGYSVGGYIESEFFFPPDARDLPERFPFHDTDLGDLVLSTAYVPVPESWAKSENEYQREAHKSGGRQLRIGINTDTEGNLLTEEVTEKQEKKGFLGFKKTVAVKRKVPKLVILPDNKDAFHEVAEGVVKVCQAMELGINQLYKYSRMNLLPLGEICLSSVHEGKSPQILFSYQEGKEHSDQTGLAKSYSIIDYKGVKVYQHYCDENKGELKVGRKEDREKGQTGTKTAERPKDAPTKLAAQPKQQEVKANSTPQNLEEKVTLDNVVGAVQAKKELIRVCDYFRNPEEYKRWGIAQKAGALLYGPSGTGKTLLARAIANEADAQFLVYKSQQILSKWSGESEGNLGKLFDEAKQHKRCILLVDEFEALARKRVLSEGSAHGTEGRMVNMLLSFLDGFERQNNVYLIGTTNWKDSIDEAILQRLYSVEVPLPNFDDRLQLVKRRIEKHQKVIEVKPFGELDYEAIAKASEGLSGRDLVGERKGIFLNLLHKAREMTKQNGGKLYIISTQDWIDEMQQLKPEPPRRIGFGSKS